MKNNLEIAELEAEIRRHNRLYYDMDAPEISDLEYDKLRKKLISLDPNSPVLAEIGNPTFGKKIQHSSTVGSLNKVHSATEIMAKFSGKTMVATPKVDGCSLTLRYMNGRLTEAITRGDGKQGEDITANACFVKDVPLTVPTDTAIEIRGEAIIPKKDFYGVMDQPGYDKDYPDGIPNPRNATSGALRQKDPSKTMQRKIRFVAYRMFNLNTSKPWSATFEQELETLQKFGFTVTEHTTFYCFVESEVHQMIQDFHKKTLPYDTDGIVFRINDEIEFEAAGYSSNCPRAAVAFKFEAETAASTITDIEWSTTRTGRVVPVAIIKPTKISGSTVSRITFNNYEWVINKDVGIGDEILFCKANEIIPKLVKVVSRASKRDYAIPETCPSCGCDLVLSDQIDAKNEDSNYSKIASPATSYTNEFEKNEDVSEGLVVHLLCKNTTCSAQVVETILHILTKLGIDGVAEATVQKMLDGGLLKNPWDILDLGNGRQEWKTKLVSTGFGNRQSEIIIDCFMNLQPTEAQVCACAGIPMWGRRMFEIVMKQTGLTMKDILDPAFSTKSLENVAGLGPSKINALIDGLANGGRDFIKNVAQRVKIEKPAAPASGTLSGKTFLLTGTLSMPRAEAEKLITQKGGTIASSVSKNLSFLIVGENAGSKLDKATKLGIQILDEANFLKMIGEQT